MSGPTLVTGAAGFAGSHLVDLLVEDGVETVAWHRPAGHQPRDVSGVTWQGVDLLDRGQVLSAIERVRPSAVYHCAGAAHVGQSWATTTRTLRTNVIGTHHLVEAVRAVVPEAQLLITSSALVYAPSLEAIGEDHPLVPSSPYGLSKLAQELVGGGNGGHPHAWIARPFNHFGPRQDASYVTAAFARQIAQIEAGLIAPELRVGNLDARRDLTDVRDTVRAYRAIVDRGAPGRPYNVCSGSALPVHEMLDTLLSLSRVDVNVVQDPSRYRPNDTPVVLGNPARIARELGWHARIPPATTLRDLLDYWRAQVSRP